MQEDQHTRSAEPPRHVVLLNLTPAIDENAITSLLSCFGKLRAVALHRAGRIMHASAEFAESRVAVMAAAGIDGMDLLDRPLRIRLDPKGVL